MKDGQALLNPTPNGAQVIVLAGSRSQPVTLEQATPAIEQFLLNERKRELVAKDMKALRDAAKIEYVGKFAAPATSTTPVCCPCVGAGAGCIGWVVGSYRLQSTGRPKRQARLDDSAPEGYRLARIGSNERGRKSADGISPRSRAVDQCAGSSGVGSSGELPRHAFAALVRYSRLAQIGIGHLTGCEEPVGDGVGGQAIDLLGHAPVARADAAFHMRHRHAQLLCGDGAGHRGRDVANHQAQRLRAFSSSCS